ncbi:MAG TPA: rhodanese-like domain-containing protein [Vicinamibacteria bacterium]
MKRRVLTLILAGMLAGAAAPAAEVPPPSARVPYTAKAKRLQRAELDALLARPEKLLIIDVRRPDELASIGGFPVYLNVQPQDLERHLAYVPRDRTIVTVSNHAARAGRAADLLAERGFDVAGAVGAQDYEAEGGTLVRVVPRAPASAPAR